MLGNRDFRIVLALLVLFTAVIGWSHHFYASAVALPKSAATLLIDDLVELHRQALSGAGDPQAPYRSWRELRGQFVIRSVQVRAVGTNRLLRVWLWTNPALAGRPAEHVYYAMHAREDDAWDIAPMTSSLPFWFR